MKVEYISVVSFFFFHLPMLGFSEMNLKEMQLTLTSFKDTLIRVEQMIYAYFPGRNFGYFIQKVTQRFPSKHTLSDC